MYKKNCFYCGGDSYSSYNDPDWQCPHCGQYIGEGKLVDKTQNNPLKKLKIVSDKIYIAK